MEPDFGARLGHAEQHRALLGRVALDGVDQIGDEIGAPLILIEYLRPGGLDLFVLGLHACCSRSPTTASTANRGKPESADLRIDSPLLPLGGGGVGASLPLRQKKPRVMSSGRRCGLQ